MDRFQDSKEHLSEEQVKEGLEEQSRLYMQQYLAANQAGDLPKCIEFIGKQTDCQRKLFGEQSTQVCSNLFLTGQF